MRSPPTPACRPPPASPGWVLAAACAYGIVALLMEDLPRRCLPPVGPSGRAASSLDGSFDEQLEAVENAAGVRRQL